MPVSIKICGLMDPVAVDAAVEGGAAFLGFLFEPCSRHALTPSEAAPLAARKKNAKAVGLFVDAPDAAFEAVLADVPLDILQLHGHEPPARVAEIKAKTGLQIIKVIHVAAKEDLEKIPLYETLTDYLLFDTKTGPTPTGGTGRAFDWRLLQDLRLTKPWFLAGGLAATNLATALAASGAKLADLSSGVENAAGAKDPEKIRALLALAHTL